MDRARNWCPGNFHGFDGLLARCGLRLAYPRRLCTSCTLHNLLYTVVEPSYRCWQTKATCDARTEACVRVPAPQCRSRVTGHFKYPNNCSFVLADCCVSQPPASRVPLFATLASTAVDFLLPYQTSILHSRSQTSLSRLVRLFLPSNSIHSLISRHVHDATPQSRPYHLGRRPWCGQGHTI